MSFPEFRNTLGTWLLHPSALKHGVAQEDISHAIEHAPLVTDLGEGHGEEGPARELWLGPNRAGNWLEVIVLRLLDGGGLVIHAMPMRRKYRPLLMRLER